MRSMVTSTIRAGPSRTSHFAPRRCNLLLLTQRYVSPSQESKHQCLIRSHLGLVLGQRHRAGEYLLRLLEVVRLRAARVEAMIGRWPAGLSRCRSRSSAK